MNTQDTERTGFSFFELMLLLSMLATMWSML